MWCESSGSLLFCVFFFKVCVRVSGFLYAILTFKRLCRERERVIEGRGAVPMECAPLLNYFLFPLFLSVCLSVCLYMYTYLI